MRKLRKIWLRLLLSSAWDGILPVLIIVIRWRKKRRRRSACCALADARATITICERLLLWSVHQKMFRWRWSGLLLFIQKLSMRILPQKRLIMSSAPNRPVVMYRVHVRYCVGPETLYLVRNLLSSDMVGAGLAPTRETNKTVGAGLAPARGTNMTVGAGLAPTRETNKTVGAGLAPTRGTNMTAEVG